MLHCCPGWGQCVPHVVDGSQCSHGYKPNQRTKKAHTSDPKLEPSPQGNMSGRGCPAFQIPLQAFYNPVSISLRYCIIYQQSSEKDWNSGFSFPFFQVRIPISDPGTRLRACLMHQTSVLRQMVQQPLCETWRHSGVTQMPKCLILSNIRHLWASTEVKFHVPTVYRVMRQLSKMLWDLGIKLYLHPLEGYRIWSSNLWVGLLFDTLSLLHLEPAIMTPSGYSCF